MVADAGDVYLTMYDVQRAAADIERQFIKLLSNGCKLLTVGGDHTITYPILRAYKVSLMSRLTIHILVVNKILQWYKRAKCTDISSWSRDV
jgi:guanidinobutyrase